MPTGVERRKLDKKQGGNYLYELYEVETTKFKLSDPDGNHMITKTHWEILTYCYNHTKKKWEKLKSKKFNSEIDAKISFNNISVE